MSTIIMEINRGRLTRVTVDGREATPAEALQRIDDPESRRFARSLMALDARAREDAEDAKG